MSYNMYMDRMRDEERILANAEEIKKNMLPLSEAEARTGRAVDYLEEQINRINGTSGRRDQERNEYLSSLFISLLAEEYGILPPTDNKE
jgi:hypothetical protein